MCEKTPTESSKKSIFCSGEKELKIGESAMFADKLRMQFVEDVIIPLCEKYGKDSREGWLVFQAAYEVHQKQHGSFALVENREKRMLERVRYMMTEFFQWLYADPELPPSSLSQRNPQHLDHENHPLPHTTVI